MPLAAKQLFSLAANTGAFSAFVTLLERLDSRRKNLLRVLAYHRVDNLAARPQLSPRLISATPTTFAKQMAYVARNYQVVSLTQVLNYYTRGEALPSGALLITFDDAYCDFAEHAWPIMQRYGLPATLFVATAYPDQPQRMFWWDQLHHALYATLKPQLHSPLGSWELNTPGNRRQAFFRLSDHVKTLPHCKAMQFVMEVCDNLQVPACPHYVLSWDELRRLASEGVTLGGHTHTHPLMHRITSDQLEQEIGGCMDSLKRHVGSSPLAFAYPGGKFNQLAVDALRRAGIALAFAMGRGINDMLLADNLRLRRIYIGSGTEDAIFRARLLSRWNIKSLRPLTGQ